MLSPYGQHKHRPIHQGKLVDVAYGIVVTGVGLVPRREKRMGRNVVYDTIKIDLKLPGVFGGGG